MTNNRKLKKPYYFTFSFSLRSFSQFMFYTFAYNWAREPNESGVDVERAENFQQVRGNFLDEGFQEWRKAKKLLAFEVNRHLPWATGGGHLHDFRNRFFNASESLTITTWSPTVLGMNYKLNVYLVMPFSTQHHEGWGFGFWLLVKSTLAAAMQFT